MKILSALLALLILVPVVAFALSNGQKCEVALWPFDGAWTVPLYVVGLLPLAAGLVVGGLWGWLHTVPHRLRARRLNKELGESNAKIDELQKTAIVQDAHAVPKHRFWVRKA
jgi:uncharacterized integral membrane protein